MHTPQRRCRFSSLLFFSPLPPRVAFLRGSRRDRRARRIFGNEQTRGSSLGPTFGPLKNRLRGKPDSSGLARQKTKNVGQLERSGANSSLIVCAFQGCAPISSELDSLARLVLSLGYFSAGGVIDH